MPLPAVELICLSYRNQGSIKNNAFSESEAVTIHIGDLDTDSEIEISPFSNCEKLETVRIGVLSSDNLSLPINLFKEYVPKNIILNNLDSNRIILIPNGCLGDIPEDFKIFVFKPLVDLYKAANPDLADYFEAFVPEVLAPEKKDRENPEYDGALYFGIDKDNNAPIIEVEAMREEITNG